MHSGVVCVHKEWCVGIRGLCVCMHHLVRSFLMSLWRCSFLSGHRLIPCAAVAGTAEPVPSNQAG